MTQRDEIFDELQTAIQINEPRINTVRGVHNIYDYTMDGLLQAVTACLTRANPFSDELVRATNLQGTGLYLPRIGVTLHRFEDHFVLRSIYRVNWASSRRHMRNRDILFDVDDALRGLGASIQSKGNYQNDGSYVIDDEDASTLRNVIDISKNRIPRVELIDGQYVSYTLVGELSELLEGSKIAAFSRYNSSYHNLSNFPVVMGMRVKPSFVQMRIAALADTITETTRQLDAYIRVLGRDLDTSAPVEPLNLVKAFQRRKPEEVYRDWLPEQENISLCIKQPRSRLSLFRRTDIEFTKQPVRQLSDLKHGNMLNVPITIEMFDTLNNVSHKIEPGVYQFLLNGEPYYDGDMFQYEEACASQLDEYRVIFPTGKMASISPSVTGQVVNRANISPRELSLPKESSLKHSHQIDKNF